MAAVISGEGLGLYNSSLNILGTKGPVQDPVMGRYGNQVYVNAYTGNLVVSQRDEFIASLGLDMAFTRTYNSLGQFDGDNNDNWRLGVHRKLSGINAGVSITKVYGDGSEIVFNYDSALGYYVSTKGDGAHDTIRAEGANWVWRDGNSDVKETYDSAGKLLNIKDSDGNTKTFSYTGNLVTGISDSSGQAVTLTYSGNNLQSITTSSSGVVQTRVTYAYDTGNRLTRVTVDLTPGIASDAETFITNYTYDGTSKRIATIDYTGGGVPDLAITYESGTGRVLTLRDGSGNVTRYAYGTTSTTVTDPLGRVSTYHYDTQTGHLTRIESPALTSGGTRLVTEYAYDTSGNVTQVKDATSAIVSFQYDSRGNLLRQIDAAGNVVVYAYTADNLLSTETVYLGDPQTTYYIYDAEKHLRFVITPEGRVTEHRYFANGTLSATLRYTKNTYSIAPLQSAPAESALSTWAAAANLAALERVDYQYDFRGQLSRSTQYGATDASGAGVASGASITHYIYDQRGQLLKSVSPRGTAPAETAATAPSAIQQNLNNHETVYVYDGLGRLISQRDALGNLTSVDYDDINNRVSTTLANGLITTQVYNNTGRLISSIEYDSAQPAADRTAYSLYDAAGQLRVSISESGAASYFFYDGAGRQVATIDPEGYLTEYSYDGNGRLLQKLSYATKVSQTLLDQLAVDPQVLELLSALGSGTTLTASGSFNAMNSNSSTTQTAQFTNGSASINTGLTIGSAYQPSSVNNYAWTLSGGQLVQTNGISLAPGTALFNDTTPTEVKATIYRSDGTLYDTVYTTVGTTTTQEIIVGRPPTQPYGFQNTATNDTVAPATQSVAVTVDSTQQYASLTTSSNVQNFGYTYNSSTRTIVGNGSGYSLVAGSTFTIDSDVTSVAASVYRSDGTFVHTAYLSPGHTTSTTSGGSYGGSSTTYYYWNGATNWNGHVNVGSLGAGNYYAVITVTDNASSNLSSPGSDGDGAWSNSNTVNFTIGGQIPDHIDTNLSWPASVVPADATTVSFRYKIGSGAWTTPVTFSAATRNYLFDRAANGTYTYEIIFKDTYGAVLKSTTSTFTVSGTTDSTPSATFSYNAYSSSATTGSSIPAFTMTASEAQSIARIEARVYQYGTVTQVGTTAVTYPAAHANYFAANGQYYVNLRTGSVLPNGRYDIQLIKYYKNGTSSSVAHTLEVGTQYESTNQNKFWSAANNWNGQVNLKSSAGNMPFDTYRVDIAVRDDATNYGSLYGTQVGSSSAPGADGDGTWTRTNTVNVTVGGRTTLQWSNAQQPQGTVVEFAYRAAGATDFTIVPVTLSSSQYSVKLDNLPPGSFEYRIRYLNANDATLTVLPALTLDQLRPQTNAADRQVNHLYDNAGRLDRTTVSSEAATVNSYDGASRLIKTEQAGAITRYFYDKDGRLAGTLDAERYFSENVYDSAGRLVQTVRYGEKVTTDRQANGTFAQIKGDMLDNVNLGPTLKSYYYYDAQGRQIGRVNEQGSLQETVYDPQYAYREEKNYLTPVTVAANDTLDTLKLRAGGSPETTRFEFDKLGRLSAKIAADGTLSNYQYNSAGLLVQTTEAAGTADERITRTRYNVFGDVTGSVTVAGADVENYAWTLSGDQLVQTPAGGGISLAAGSALFNDTSPTEVKATIYKSNGTLHSTVTTTVGVTEIEEIAVNNRAPVQPYGYQATATSDTSAPATQTVTMSVDSTPQYANLTTSANVQNFSYTYNSSNRTIVGNGSGYSLVAGSATRVDNTPTVVYAKIYTAGGTLVQTVDLRPGHTTTQSVTDPYTGNVTNYRIWNGATNWNGHVNLGSLNPGHYYAEISTYDDATVGDNTSTPGKDGDGVWERHNTVNFTIGGQAVDHYDVRLSWPDNAPADTTSVVFEYWQGSNTPTAKTVGLTGAWPTQARYVDFDHIDNGTYNYRILYKNTYGSTLKSTTATFTVNGGADSSPTAVFNYTGYYSSDEVAETVTIDSSQQYGLASTTSSNVADYSWTYDSGSRALVDDGEGYSLIAGSATRVDNSVTSVEADIYKSDGTFVKTVTLTPGHTTSQNITDPYTGTTNNYKTWNSATNWNGQVNLGALSPGDYRVDIRTYDSATPGQTDSPPGMDGDSVWSRTNTVYFTIGAQIADHIDTRVSWSETLTPTGTSNVTFRYRLGSSGDWESKIVRSDGSSRYVNFEHTVDGTYQYEIVYLDSSGKTLKRTSALTPPTFTISGAADSTSSALFRYSPGTSASGTNTVGSSLTAYSMTPAEAQTVARIEAKVFLAGTGTQVGTTAITYPAAHADYLAVDGQYRVNLSVGSVLADGKYDVQIVKFYKSGAVSAVDQHTIEVGLQATEQKYFWNAADNWNGQVNLLVGSGSLPADTYRIEISVKDTAGTYGASGTTQLGGTSAPGADGDGTWTRITNVYTTIGSPTAASWNSAIDRYGVRYEIDGAGRRISELHPNGQKTLLYYDQSGRQIYSINGIGAVTAYTYNAFGEVASTKTYSATISTAGLVGGAVTNTLTDRIAAAAVAGTVSETGYTYTKAGRLASVEDAEDYLTTYAYNSRGERTDETRAISAGNTVNTHYELDLLGRVTAATYAYGSPEAARTATSYDGFGRVASTFDARNKETKYTYELTSNGHMVTVKDAANRINKTEYDALGRVLNVYDGFNQRTTYVYDTDQRSITVTTPDGVSVTTWRTRTGEILKVQDGNGGVTEYDYTMDGKLATVRDAKGVAITQNSYDNSGRLTDVRDARGILTRYIYDAANRTVERIVDPGTPGTYLNLRTTYQFDDQNRKLRVTEGAGTTEATSTDYIYDKKGQLKQIIVDPTGLQLSTRYTYDGLGNTKTVEQGTVAIPAKKVTQYSYDKLGRKTVEQVDPAGLNITTQYKYDANGRLIQLINANGHKTWYGYDDSGKLLREVDQLGGVTRHYYDANGRLSETVRFFNTVNPASLTDTATGIADPAPSAYDARTLYVYDGGNRQRYVLQAVNGTQWTVSENLYDNNGNIIETRRYDRHLDNASLSTKLASGGILTDAEMAELGYASVNLGSKTQRTFYAYDANNRLRFTVNALGEASENVYDAAGNITRQTRFAAAPALNGDYSESNINDAVNRTHSGNQTTQFIYDRAGRVTRTIDALSKSEYFSYDALGNKKTYTNKNGAVWEYKFDKAGRLEYEITPAVEIASGANSDARLRRLKTEYGYDELGNVRTRTEGIILNADGSADSSVARTTTYGYDAAGRQTSTAMPGWYDPATGRVEKESAAGRFRIASDVTYDALGNAVRNRMRVGSYGTAGEYIYQYKTYDALGRVKHDIDALGNVTTNTYDAPGNLTTIKRSANALTTPIPAPAYWTSVGVEQDLAGKPTANDRTITMKYDRAGRKTETAQTSAANNYNPANGATYPAAATTSYHYNALGQLIAEDAKINQTETARTYHFYDLLNRETAAVDAMGYVTVKEYVRNNVNNLEEERTIEYANAGGVTGGLENPELQLPQQLSYADRLTVNVFDKLHRLTSVSRSAVSIDAAGNLTSTTKLFLTNTYDNAGNIVAVRDVNNQTTSTQYDALGRVMHVTEPKRTMAADNAINPFTSTVTVSPVTDFVLDAFGNAVKIERSAAGAQNGGKITTSQTFDHVGNLLETASGFSGSAQTEAGIIRYEYDVAGRVIKDYRIAEARPNVRLAENRYYYDATGRQLAKMAVVTDSSGVKQQSGKGVVYNAFGDISQETQVWGVATVTSHSALSSRTLRGFTYDAMGRVSSSQAKDGLTEYYYDLLGHATREVKKGNSGTTSDDRITETVYDALGRAILQRLPSYTGIAVSLGTTTGTLNPVMTQQFDRWGNVVKRIDAANRETKYDYNHDNQVIRETLPAVAMYKENDERYLDANGADLPLVHEIHYNGIDVNGVVVVREVDKVNGVELRSRSNEYDATGRLTRTIDATKRYEEYKYDALGNQVASRKGMLNDPYIGSIYVDTYDAYGQQIEHAVLRKADGTAYTGSGTPVKVVLNTYDYDAAGRRVAEWSYVSTGSGGTTQMKKRFSKRYEYNELGQVTWFSNEAGIQTTYKYNMHGDKLEETNALGHTQKWTYDANNYTFGRLSSSRDIGDKLKTYVYGDFGQLIQESRSGSWQKTYSYHENGLLESVTQSLGEISLSSAYDYDILGNRVKEIHSDIYQGTTSVYDAYTGQYVNVPAIQSGSFTQLMAYDARDRLSTVKLVGGGRAHGNDMGYMLLDYKYDEFGNRRNIHAVYKEPTESTNRTYDIWYAYDKEGRVLIEDGTRTSGAMTISSGKGIRLYYDGAGQRKTEEGTKHEAYSVPTSGSDGGYYNYTTTYLTNYNYNDLGLVASMIKAEYKSGYFNPNGGGTQTYNDNSTKTTTFSYDLRGFKLVENRGSGDEVITSTYLADGRMDTQTTLEDGDLVGRVTYDRYDEAGNLLRYHYTNYDGDDYTNYYEYSYTINNGEYKNNGIEVDSDLSGYSTGETEISFDVFGNISHTKVNNGRNSSNVVVYTHSDLYYNTDGQIVYNYENRPNTEYSTGDTRNSHVYVNGNTVAKLSDSGNSEFSSLVVDKKGMQQAATPSQYIVQGDETLQSISQTMYGNWRYWYLIADANGLNYGASDRIPAEDAGRALKIPNVVSNKFNDANTFKPYNPAEIIGDLTPSPVAPPPPKHKSNAFAAILMIIVAVVVTIFTAGAAAGATANLWATGLSAMSGGLSAGVGASMVAAAAGSFVGSLASQVVGKALGVVDKISLRSAFASGLTAGITAGVGGALKATDISWLKTATNGTLSTGGKFVMGAAGYAGSYVSNKIVGMDAHFDWKDLAINAVSSVASGFLNDKLLNKDLIGNSIVRGTMQGIAGAAIHGNMSRNWSDGKKLDWGQVALDAFGNALANAFVERMAKPPKPAVKKIEVLVAGAAGSGSPSSSVNRPVLPGNPISDADREYWLKNNPSEIERLELFPAEAALKDLEKTRRNKIADAQEDYGDIFGDLEEARREGASQKKIARLENDLNEAKAELDTVTANYDQKVADQKMLIGGLKTRMNLSLEIHKAAMDWAKGQTVTINETTTDSNGNETVVRSAYKVQGSGAQFSTIEAAAKDGIAYAFLVQAALGDDWERGANLTASQAGFSYDELEVGIPRMRHSYKLNAAQTIPSRTPALPGIRPQVLSNGAMTDVVGWFHTHALEESNDNDFSGWGSEDGDIDAFQRSMRVSQDMKLPYLKSFLGGNDGSFDMLFVNHDGDYEIKELGGPNYFGTKTTK